MVVRVGVGIGGRCGHRVAVASPLRPLRRRGLAPGSLPRTSSCRRGGKPSVAGSRVVRPVRPSVLLVGEDGRERELDLGEDRGSRLVEVVRTVVSGGAIAQSPLPAARSRSERPSSRASCCTTSGRPRRARLALALPFTGPHAGPSSKSRGGRVGRRVGPPLRLGSGRAGLFVGRAWGRYGEGRRGRVLRRTRCGGGREEVRNVRAG